jgi:nitrile hydratase subunit beta
MNGVHDVGGMHGFGPVIRDPDEPVFHAEWEGRTFGLTLAMMAWRRWNLDMNRSILEQMPPAEYLATTYYEHWLFALERLLVEHGFVAPEEMARVRLGAPATPSGPDAAPDASAARAEAARELQEGALGPEHVSLLVGNRQAARLDDPVPPRFRIGQTVLARNIHPTGHTRLPRYVRGRRGVVVIDHGVFIFPDTHAAGEGTRPQHVYSVQFAARELWGPDAPPRNSVCVDLWDDYLDAVP